MMQKALPTIFSIIFFVTGVITSYVVDTSDNLYCGNEEPVRNILGFYNIFSNNIKVVILLISGGFVMRITTAANLISNGFIVGFSIVNTLHSGASLTEIMLLILPHGIFEIPAIVIAGAAGFKIPYEIIAI